MFQNLLSGKLQFSAELFAFVPFHPEVCWNEKLH